MIISLKKILFNFTFNSSLFLILFIGIQNSSNKARVSLLNGETVQLPISFIIGTSFISGSIIGSILPINFLRNNS